MIVIVINLFSLTLIAENKLVMNDNDVSVQLTFIYAKPCLGVIINLYYVVILLYVLSSVTSCLY